MQKCDSFLVELVLVNKTLDKSSIDWSKYQDYLIRRDLPVDLFPMWFRKGAFTYSTDNITKLITHYNRYFDLWWDPHVISLRSFSGLLCIYCSQHFLKWWDPEQFDYSYASNLLYCWDYKEIWLDKNPHFDPTIDFLKNLITYFSDKFDEWWHPEWFYSNGRPYFIALLAEHCHEYFDKWWIPEKIYSDWELTEEDILALMKYCPEHFDKWKDFMGRNITRKEILEWIAQNHPEYLEKILPVFVDLDILPLALQYDVSLSDRRVCQSLKDLVNILTFLDSKTFEKLRDEVLTRRSSRIHYLIDELTKRGLYNPFDPSDYSGFHPSCFRWDKGTITLLTEFADYFDIWWSTEYFPWQEHSKDLCKYLPDKFLSWWNPFKFKEDHYWALAKYCKDYIHVWGRYVFKQYSQFLEDLSTKDLEKLKLLITLGEIKFDDF